jgi:ubiquinone/menaquinone biosynthesis C-methylase UbiE
MKDYYLNGEERFGFFRSFLYFVAIKIPVFQNLYEFVEQDMLKSQAKVILDVGTGPGDIALFLAKTDLYNIYAIDPSKDMIRIAKQRAHGLNNPKFALGSSRYIPFKLKFDVIYTALSFHHWEKKSESLNYISKFLAKDGEIRIYEYNAHKTRGFHKATMSSHALKKEDLAAILAKTELRISKIYEKGPLMRVSLKKKSARVYKT